MTHLSMKPILERVHQADTFDELRSIRDQVHEMLREHLLFAHSLELHQSMNRLHDAWIRRTVAIAERQLEKQGHGKPPVPYALMLFGSGGRSEQTPWSDQDNGFIYADAEGLSEGELDAYFSRLAACTLEGLETLGYPPCEGNVVSSNEQWRKPYSAYIRMMEEWLAEPTWEHVRYLLIMADMRCIYGSEALVNGLKRAFFDDVERHPHLLKNLLSNTLHHKVSLGVFNHLITERYGEDAGGFDIKYGAYIPIINGIRLLAIWRGISATSTLGRLEGLLNGGYLSREYADVWRSAFITALKLRDLTPSQSDNGMYATRGKLSAEQLTRARKRELKSCLRAGLELQRFVKKSIEAHIERETGKRQGARSD